MKKYKSLFLLFIFIAWFPQRVYAQTPTPPNGPVYIVQEGDTLWDIAMRFNLSMNELATANGLSDGGIFPGDQIILPGMEGISGILTSRTIGYGESLRTLLCQYQFEKTLMIKLNHLTSPTELYAGANLILLQDETQSNYSSQANLLNSGTLLELSVLQDTDPWTIVQINDIPGSWAGLPDDVFCLAGGEEIAQPTGMPSIFGSVVVDPLPIIQGTTVEINITPLGDASFSGLLIDKTLHFFPSDEGSMIALQGVHALADPGLYPLRLEATFSDGSKQSFEQNVLVVSGGYPEDPLLYVDPSTIDPAVTEPETALILSMVENATSQRLWNGVFTTPASQYADSTYFTSRFGNRRTYIGIGTDLSVFGFHTGLDFGGGVGLPITAPADGKVVFAELLTVRGNATIIDHGWGVYSGFWHQSAINVQVGDLVQKGQVIGLVGGTGRVTGAHLHWEIWVNGVQVDPLQWLNDPFPN